MADGKTHFIGNVAAGTALVVGAMLLDVPTGIVWGLALGSIFGTLVTPDYDIDGTTFTEAVILSIPIIGLAWVTLWYPYAKMFKHRQRSHNLILGTIGRAVWMLLIGAFISVLWYGISNSTWETVTAFLQPLRLFTIQGLAAFITAWFIQDQIHYLLDVGGD